EDMVNHPTIGPNLWDATNSNEVGNLVRTSNPIVLNPNEVARIEASGAHLAMSAAANISGSHFFDFSGSGRTGQEERLLESLGKVFFYEVHVYENGNPQGIFIAHPEVATLPSGAQPGVGGATWQPVPVNPNVGTGFQQGYMPVLGTHFDLFYYDDTNRPDTFWTGGLNSECDSFEVVFDVNSMSHLWGQNISGVHILGMGFTPHPFTFWQASSLDLSIR